MPITTILQYQRERRRLVQPNLDTPMPDRDQGPSLRDELQDIRLQWALAVEEHAHVSLLTPAEKAAAVAARWNPPDSSYTVELLNRPFKPDSSRASMPSTSQGSPGFYDGNQMGTRKIASPQRMPPDVHDTRRPTPANHTSKPGAIETPQHDSQQYSSAAYNTGLVSPDVYHITHRAVNALWAHKRGETASDDNNVRQAVSNPRVDEQAVPRTYSLIHTPPASQSSAQTSPLQRPIAGLERIPPLLDHKHRVPPRAINRNTHPAGSMRINSQCRLFDRRPFNVP
ncbi:hypothetical protein V8C26DRAFT_428851 [Trichoderma gracile]